MCKGGQRCEGPIGCSSDIREYCHWPRSLQTISYLHASVTDTGDNDTLDGGDATSLGSHTAGGCIVNWSGWQWQLHPTWWAHLVSVQSVYKLTHSPLAPHHPAQDVNGRQGKLRTALQHRDVPVGGGEGRDG